MIDRKTFFDRIRISLFGGHLTTSQVEGISAKLDEWDRRRLTDVRWLAYIFATSYHETGRAMVPVREGGRGKGHHYGKPDPETGLVYYGRGDVQLTWKKNYDTLGDLIGVDLVNNPDAALDSEVSAKVLFEGMIHGSFTGKKLSMYFSGSHDDPVNARRIVNGVDKASLIAGYHAKFLSAIHAAETVRSTAAPSPIPRTRPVPTPQPIDDTENTPPSPLPEPSREYDPAVVLKVQQELRRLRYWSAGEPDGVFANMTEDAILAFRKDNNLPLTPTIDDELLAKLSVADPRPISDKRANAQAKDVEGKLATVRTSWLSQIWAWLLGIPAAITTAVSGGSDTFDNVRAYAEPIREMFGGIPGWIWGLGVLAAVVAIVRLNSKGKRAAVRAYQEGRLQ